MRWEELFADVEARWAAQQRRDLDAEVVDRTRAERASVRLVDRLRAAGTAVVELQLRAGEPVRGHVLDSAPEWVLLAAAGGVAGWGAAPDEGADRVLVPLAAVAGVRGLPGRAAPAPLLAQRRTLVTAVRALAVARCPVRVRTIAGTGGSAGARELHGTVERVGADHLDLVEHERGELPRQGGRTTTVPWTGLVAVIDAEGRWSRGA